MMLMQTVMVLATSISNSGELNILSLLAAVAIDQLIVRPVVGLTVWIVCKIYLSIKEQELQKTVE